MEVEKANLMQSFIPSWLTLVFGWMLWSYNAESGGALSGIAAHLPDHSGCKVRGLNQCNTTSVKIMIVKVTAVYFYLYNFNQQLQ